MKKCPVCRMSVDELPQTVTLVRGDDQWEFCSEDCRDAYVADPARYESTNEDEDE